GPDAVPDERGYLQYMRSPEELEISTGYYRAQRRTMELLSLSRRSKLGCAIVRAYLIERIAESGALFDPVTLATLGLKYQIDGWPQKNFKELITRTAAPSLEDGVALGMERILAICRCREIYRSSRDRAPRSSFTSIIRASRTALLESLIAQEPSLKNPLAEKLDEVRFQLATGDGNLVKHPQHYVSQLHNVMVDGVVWRATLKTLGIDQSIVEQFQNAGPDQVQDQAPLNLTGHATVQELESYLNVVNGRHFAESYGNSICLSFSLWAGVLRLATILGNSRARNFVIRFVEIHLQDEDPFDIIDAAKSCKVHSWLQPQYLRIAKRSTFPTEAEAERLGAQSLLVVCRLREESRAAPPTG
ncbi:hypothetical protein FRC01_010567, partial [Tulasnella sp. 417]